MHEQRPPTNRPSGASVRQRLRPSGRLVDYCGRRSGPFARVPGQCDLETALGRGFGDAPVRAAADRDPELQLDDARVDLLNTVKNDLRRLDYRLYGVLDRPDDIPGPNTRILPASPLVRIDDERGPSGLVHLVLDNLRCHDRCPFTRAEAYARKRRCSSTFRYQRT